MNDHDHTKYGKRLFTPDYVRSDKTWTIVIIAIRRMPDWALTSGGLALFREICYLNALGEVEGLGRSWIPLSRANWPIIQRCYRPIWPLPLGLALEQVYGSNLDIDVREARPEIGVLARYREASDSVICFKRVFRSKSAAGVVLVATEEDLLTSIAVPNAGSSTEP